jgi:hypothetical protein
MENNHFWLKIVTGSLNYYWKNKKQRCKEVEELDETTRGGQGFGSSSIREVQMGNLDKEVKKAYKNFQVDMDI